MNTLDRRSFIMKTSALSAAIAGTTTTNLNAQEPPLEEGMFVIGPVKGYTPMIGTLVSMLNYNRQTIINMVKGFSKEQLDFLLDKNANSIGALLLHLGATEKYYQINTFEGRQDFNDEEKKIWESAMELGDAGRRDIKGHDVKYYLDIIEGVRQKTIDELKKKDDAWLLAIDPEWSKKEPLNTFWKWFHVCEHESNHRGQIAFQRTRLPGAKWSNK